MEKNVLFSEGKSSEKFPENRNALDSQELVFVKSHCHGTVEHGKIQYDVTWKRVIDFVISELYVHFLTKS